MIRVCIAALAPDTGRLSFFNIVFNWLFISVFTLADTISGLRAPGEAISGIVSGLKVISKSGFLAWEGESAKCFDLVLTCRREKGDEEGMADLHQNSIRTLYLITPQVRPALTMTMKYGRFLGDCGRTPRIKISVVKLSKFALLCSQLIHWLFDHLRAVEIKFSSWPHSNV